MKRVVILYDGVVKNLTSVDIFSVFLAHWGPTT